MNKKRFWQFHLSTLVMFVLVGGAFLGLNIEKRSRTSVIRFHSVTGPGEESLIYEEYGFPCTFYSYSPSVSIEKLVYVGNGPYQKSAWEVIEDVLDYWPYLDERLLLIDVLVFAIVLIVLGVASEKFIALRERRNGATG